MKNCKINFFLTVSALISVVSQSRLASAGNPAIQVVLAWDQLRPANANWSYNLYQAKYGTTNWSRSALNLRTNAISIYYSGATVFQVREVDSTGAEFAPSNQLVLPGQYPSTPSNYGVVQSVTTPTNVTVQLAWRACSTSEMTQEYRIYCNGVLVQHLSPLVTGTVIQCTNNSALVLTSVNALLESPTSSPKIITVPQVQSGG